MYLGVAWLRGTHHTPSREVRLLSKNELARYFLTRWSFQPKWLPCACLLRASPCVHPTTCAVGRTLYGAGHADAARPALGGGRHGHVPPAEGGTGGGRAGGVPGQRQPGGSRGQVTPVSRESRTASVAGVTGLLVAGKSWDNPQA